MEMLVEWLENYRLDLKKCEVLIPRGKLLDEHYKLVVLSEDCIKLVTRYGKCDDVELADIGWVMDQCRDNFGMYDEDYNRFCAEYE